jgi:hypothetical protein
MFNMLLQHDECASDDTIRFMRIYFSVTLRLVLTLQGWPKNFETSLRFYGYGSIKWPMYFTVYGLRLSEIR